MRRWRGRKGAARSSETAALLWIPALLVLGAPDLMAKGTPWEIKENGAADFDGGTKKIVVGFVCPAGTHEANLTEVILVAHGFGASEADKATNICDEINNYHAAELTASVVGGNRCRFEVAAASPCTDIKEAKASEGPIDRPGDTGVCVKDDPPPVVPIKSAILDYTGTGVTGGGTATLQIGETNPVISVSTLGKGESQIETELAAAFNANSQFTWRIRRCHT